MKTDTLRKVHLRKRLLAEGSAVQTASGRFKTTILREDAERRMNAHLATTDRLLESWILHEKGGLDLGKGQQIVRAITKLQGLVGPYKNNGKLTNISQMVDTLIKELRRFNKPGLLQKLLSVFDSKNPLARATAFQAIILGGSEMIPTLMQQFQSDLDESQPLNAQVSDPERGAEVKELQKALTQAFDAGRFNAVSSLAKSLTGGAQSISEMIVTDLMELTPSELGEFGNSARGIQKPSDEATASVAQQATGSQPTTGGEETQQAQSTQPDDGAIPTKKPVNSQQLFQQHMGDIADFGKKVGVQMDDDAKAKTTLSAAAELLKKLNMNPDELLKLVSA